MASAQSQRNSDINRILPDMFTVGFKLDTFTVSETGPSSTVSIILLAGNFFHNAIHCWHGLSYPCLPYTTLTWIWPHALKLSCTVLSPRWEAPCGPEKYMGKVCACVWGLSMCQGLHQEHAQNISLLCALWERSSVGGTHLQPSGLCRLWLVFCAELILQLWCLVGT